MRTLNKFGFYLTDYSGACFVCNETGEKFILCIYLDRSDGDFALYSPDGGRYFELEFKVRHFNILGDELVYCDCSFVDPRTGKWEEFTKKGNTISWGEKTFVQVECPKEVAFCPLVPDCLYRTEEGQFVYLVLRVGKAAIAFDVFCGELNNMVSVPIKAVTWDKEGLASVETENGSLSVREERKSYWDGKPLVDLNASNYAVAGIAMKEIKPVP